jgi:RNA polymerase sigma-70 factor (ECF subfamily)
LVARAQRGDKRAFELLVEKYQRKLGRLLSRFIRDPAEVEDVTQEDTPAHRWMCAFKLVGGHVGKSAWQLRVDTGSSP